MRAEQQLLRLLQKLAWRVLPFAFEKG